MSDPSTTGKPALSIASSGIVRIVNATFYAHHGVMHEERRLGNRYEVDVAMHLDFEVAGASDAIEDTVDYYAVYDTVKQIITENKFYLIERVAYLIGRALLERHPLLDEVEVTVRKHNPPVGGNIDRTEAVYRAVRKTPEAEG